MARPKLPLHLTLEQKTELQRLVRAPGTPQKIVRRARIALLAAEGKDNKQIAAELRTSHVTVGQWRQRLLDLGLAGLEEAPRPGAAQKPARAQDPNRVERSGSAAQGPGALELPDYGPAQRVVPFGGAAVVGRQRSEAASHAHLQAFQ